MGIPSTVADATRNFMQKAIPEIPNSLKKRHEEEQGIGQEDYTYQLLSRAAPVDPLQYVMAHDAPDSMAALMQQTTIGIPVFRGMERQYFDFSRAENLNAFVRVQAADIVGDTLHADLDPDTRLS